jgi:oligosaccharyl transferase (archaeosortase A-associated)
MSGSRFSPKLIAGLIVALFFGVALYLRIGLSYNQVFIGDWINFPSVDAYYHMRLVDNLIHNFPHRLSFDAYSFFPSGYTVTWAPFFDWFLAGITWLIGLGSPTQHTIDLVGVYLPAILGALTVIPVYFIGKELFNRWAGVIAAGLVGLFPGEFLGRSMLGWTDHHVAETLFSTLAILFLILAVKTARRRQLTFNHIKRRDWATSTRPLIYSLLAGVFLGIYLLTWTGALLFPFIVFIYFVVQFIVDHLKGRATDYLCLVGTPMFCIALILFVPVSQDKLYLLPLVIGLFAPLVLFGISRLMSSRGLKTAYYPLTLVGLSIAGLVIFRAINPSFFGSMLGQFGYIFIWHKGTTIFEMQPIFFPSNEFSFQLVWSNFTTGFFVGLVSLVILVYLVIKHGETEKTLFVVWSLTILAATLGQRRFAYYFVVNVALLTGYFSWLILKATGFKETVTKPLEIPVRERSRKAKLKKPQKGGFRFTGSQAKMTLGLIVVFFLSFFPNIGPAMDTAAGQPGFGPDAAWRESLSWLKDNTPEPFGNPDFYYEYYEPPLPGESYSYPETAYGVMSWWDYGHWITRIARRLPNATPAMWGGCGHFFSAQDEASASELSDSLGIRYVIIDHQMVTGKFYAVATIVGKNKEDFYDVYYLPQNGELVPVTFLYPEYYRSMVVRLYNFNGEEVSASGTMVISYEERISQEGWSYKEATSLMSFPSSGEAEAYIASQESGNHRIVSNDPFASPVPLKKLEHYKLIYESDSTKMQGNIGMVPLIKIFEYVK